jgi:hypothetical protein
MFGFRLQRRLQNRSPVKDVLPPPVYCVLLPDLASHKVQLTAKLTKFREVKCENLIQIPLCVTLRPSRLLLLIFTAFRVLRPASFI